VIGLLVVCRWRAGLYLVFTFCVCYDTRQFTIEHPYGARSHCFSEIEYLVVLDSFEFILPGNAARARTLENTGFSDLWIIYAPNINLETDCLPLSLEIVRSVGHLFSISHIVIYYIIHYSHYYEILL
jgi:hypothetical protein